MKALNTSKRGVKGKAGSLSLLPPSRREGTKPLGEQARRAARLGPQAPKRVRAQLYAWHLSASSTLAARAPSTGPCAILRTHVW
jgi:hypothetical protein